MTLTISDLTGGYTNVPVIKNINLTVPSGQLMALIGLNGAGKSTIINHIIGLLHPMSGSIKLDELDLLNNPSEFKNQLAYIPELPLLYEELTLKEHIELTIKAYHLQPDQAWQKANILLEKFRLSKRLNWFPVDFSKGMKQKVMILCAFITDARLLVIDEPFMGLDPLAIADLLQLIEEKKQQGVTVIMSTHVLDTAERYCDQFAMVMDGQILSVGNLSHLQSEFKLPDRSLSELYLQVLEGANHE